MPMGPGFNQENIADRDRNTEPRRPNPPANVPGPGAPPLPEPDPPPSGAGGRPNGPGAFRLQPSGAFCDFSGPNRLKNFGLPDVYGQTWEFRQHQGRLVLLDFWGTWCMPCVKAIPHVKRLQAEYGQSGLEVIGIAMENDGNAQEQGYRVGRVAKSLNANYRQLLSAGPKCPVKDALRINTLPTIVLLDQDGTILWRCTNKLDRNKFDELDRLIRSKLSAQ